MQYVIILSHPFLYCLTIYKIFPFNIAFLFFASGNITPPISPANLIQRASENGFDNKIIQSCIIGTL